MRLKTTVTAAAMALALVATSGAQAGTLEDVQARGVLRCVVSTGIAGFAAPNADGVWEGFDIDFCRATAAAVLGDANAIEAVTSTGKTRFTRLNAGEGDVLWRNTTITFSRDVGVKLRFHGVNYYDGQGFMVRKDLGISSATEHDGASAWAMKTSRSWFSWSLIGRSLGFELMVESTSTSVSISVWLASGRNFTASHLKM